MNIRDPRKQLKRNGTLQGKTVPQEPSAPVPYAVMGFSALAVRG